MQTQIIPLVQTAPGVQHSLQVMRFGVGLPGPKAYIQASLHADEAPAMLVAHQLAQALTEQEENGALRGEVIVVPYANPIGLAQIQLGQQEGRFDLTDGINFNRGYPDLAELVQDTVGHSLNGDADHNVHCIRQAFRDALQALTPTSTTQHLKYTLMSLASDADVVLDLHCDNDAVMHLYGMTAQSDQLEELGCLLGAQAILTSQVAGDNPFDESCALPWQTLQTSFPQHPIPMACFGATVELRGERDTDMELARQDASAILGFLARRGALADDRPSLPPALCTATPLNASEPLVAPHAGVIVYHHAPGETVAAGTTIADVFDPATGQATPVRCQSDGVFYARSAHRWATPGKRLGKVAGRTLQRSGKLLSP
jgi:predicted deacylase